MSRMSCEVKSGAWLSKTYGTFLLIRASSSTSMPVLRRIRIATSAKVESRHPFLPSLTLNGDMAQNGSPLTAWAFQEGLRPILGDFGYLLITLGVVLFGVSTAISWSYYGDRAVVYLFGTNYILPYKIIFVVMHFLGAIFSLEVVWNLGDSALGLMSLPNLIALILLAPQVRRLTKEYFDRDHKPLR